LPSRFSLFFIPRFSFYCHASPERCSGLMSSSDRVRDQEEARSNDRIMRRSTELRIPRLRHTRWTIGFCWRSSTAAGMRNRVFRRDARCGEVGGDPKKREPHLSLYRLHSPRDKRAIRLVDWHGKGLESWQPSTLHSDNKRARRKRKEVRACLRRDDNYTVGNGGELYRW